MNIPIYRAKKIDSDQYVEGDLLAGKYISQDYDPYYEEPYTTRPSFVVNGVREIKHGGHWTLDNIFEIDPSTLEISLDSENWKSMKDLEEMFIFDNEMMKIDIDAGGRVK